MKVNQEVKELIQQNIEDLLEDYEPKSIKKLHNNIQTQEEFDDFRLLYKAMKRKYTLSLITDLYIKYKDNARAIEDMNNKMKNIGLVTLNFSLSVSTLDELRKIIITEHDFACFTEVYEENKNRCGILMLIKLYKDRNTPIRC